MQDYLDQLNVQQTENDKLRIEGIQHQAEIESLKFQLTEVNIQLQIQNAVDNSKNTSETVVVQELKA